MKKARNEDEPSTGGWNQSKSLTKNRHADNAPLKGKTVLLVNTGSNTSTGDDHKKFIYKRIGELGVDVVALNKVCNLRTKYVRHWILANPSNHDNAIRAIEEFLANNPDCRIDGVVTFYEDSILLTSKIAERLKKTGISYKVADLVRNKYKFRSFCEKHGFPTPKFVRINKASDLALISEGLRYPIVLKPVYGASSAFVIKVEDEESLRTTYDYIRRNISTKTESALGSTTTLLAEEYIDGDEVDINILLQNGRIKFYNITDNHQTNEPFFIETGMTEPSALLDSQKEDLIDMADGILEVLGVQNGCIQFEAKSTAAGPVPLEINLRMGGDEAYFFAKEAWGVDLIEGALKIATNQYFKKLHKGKTPRKFLAGETMHAAYSGVVAKIDIDGRVAHDKGLENLEIFKKVGDSILAPPFGYEYMGWVSVSGPNPVDTRDKLNQILRRINYTIVKFDESSSMGRTFRKVKRHNAVLAAIDNKRIVGKERIEKIRSMPLSEQRKLHVGVACNDYSLEKDANIIENDLFVIGKNIEKTLADVGYNVSFFDFNNPQKAIENLHKSKIDLIFNVCERINETSLLEPHAASIFDVLQIPYTGSSPFTLALCIDKIKVKKLLSYHNIPTPAWDYVFSNEDGVDSNLRFPLIVKPANTDNSIGITNESVVTDYAALKARIRYVINELKSPALIEEYIEGDEYNVFIMGNDDSNTKVLPLSRTIFSGLPKNYWHIKTLEGKFGRDETYKKNIVLQVPPRNVSDKLMKLMTEMALDTYNILDCHDYGRAEIKIDKNNNPYLLELNPNPSIGAEDVMDLSLKGNKFTYGEFLEEIIGMMIKRYKDETPYRHLQTNIL